MGLPYENAKAILRVYRTEKRVNKQTTRNRKLKLRKMRSFQSATYSVEHSNNIDNQVLQDLRATTHKFIETRDLDKLMPFRHNTTPLALC